MESTAMQDKRRQYLINELLNENKRYRSLRIPKGADQQKQMLRSLINVRMPKPISDRFLSIQDQYLQEENRNKGFVRLTDMNEVKPDLYIWQGDITRLEVGAIVNAANSGMTGCYQPCHSCIDNCIHTYAGIQLRNYCADLMKKQGHEEAAGMAKITPAYNLPCSYVIHTVGPIVQGGLNMRHQELLASCYRSCLDLAAENRVDSIAFCCISTGVFRFPAERAAQIAVKTVREYKWKNKSNIKVVFNVFKDADLTIYRKLLG